MTKPVSDPDKPHWAALIAPPGGEWTGRARYAAAMHYYFKGEMDAETLEIYRITARLDDEDPLDLMRRWQVGAGWIRRIEKARSGR